MDTKICVDLEFSKAMDGECFVKLKLYLQGTPRRAFARRLRALVYAAIEDLGQVGEKRGRCEVKKNSSPPARFRPDTSHLDQISDDDLPF